MEKTNVMRLLDAAKIAYTSYICSIEHTDVKIIAGILGEDLN